MSRSSWRGAPEVSRAGARPRSRRLRRLGGAASSQARNRTTAAPSRTCAARAPLISAAHLRAFGSMHGSRPRTMAALPSARAIANAAVSASSRTFFLAVRSAFSRAGKSFGRHAGARRGARCAAASASILRASMNSSALPLAGTIANASVTGLCATSVPRMLSSQQIESGSVSTAASWPSSFSRFWRSASFSSAGVPAYFSGCTMTVPAGTAGRSLPHALSSGLGDDRLQHERALGDGLASAVRSRSAYAATDRSRRSRRLAVARSASRTASARALPDREQSPCRPVARACSI